MILVPFSSLRYKNSTRNHSKHRLTLKFPLSYPRNLKFRSIVKKKSCKNKIRGKHDSGGFSSFRRRLVPSVTYAGIWITSTGGSRKFYFTAMLLRETGRKKGVPRARPGPLLLRTTPEAFYRHRGERCSWKFILITIIQI